MKKHKYRYSFIAVILALTLYSSCAQVGRPEGGPKDETPPVLELSKPENMTTNFSSDKIVIEFDENIQLKDLNEQLVISPPMTEKAEIKTNMNKLLIKFIDSLHSNTTYTINFGNSIADLNESNVFEDYHYTFSTGSVIDSFQVNGVLTNAFDEEPILGATVLLHSNLSDTAFLSIIPNYIAKTDSSGYFSIKHIAPGEYKLYALKESKFNYTYEIATEELAFLPEIVIPEIKEVTVIDTIKIVDTIIPVKTNRDSINFLNRKDSLNKVINIDSLINRLNKIDSIRFDTIFHDSIVQTIVPEYFPKDIHLKMFIEVLEIQFIAEKKRDEKEKLEIIFNLDVDSLFEIELVDSIEHQDWKILEKTDKKSYTVWLKDSSIYNKENLSFVVHYQTLDSLENLIIINDTLNLNFFKEKKEKKKVSQLKININETKKFIPLYEEVQLTFSAPLIHFITDSIKLYELEDTLKIPTKYTLIQDSIIKRQYNLSFDRKLETNYKIVIDSASLFDIFGNTNLVFENTFQIQDSSFYSNIILNITNIKEESIVQLLDAKKEVLKEFFITKDSLLDFNFLKGGSYYFKVITDANSNRKWDTGNFQEGLLPEKVYFYQKEIKTKAAWSNEINWDILNDEPIDELEENKKLKKLKSNK